jgi:hypothetical protein
VSIALLCLLAVLVCLGLVGRYNETVAARRWDEALGPEPAEVYGRVKDSIEAQTLMVEMSYRGAALRQHAGLADEATHLLGLGSRSLDVCSTSLLHLLRGTRSLARRARALGPVPALPRAAFRTTEVRGLALLHRGLHPVLLTLRERLGLRLGALGAGVRIVSRLLNLSTERALDDPDCAQWERMEALSVDLGALGREALATLRVVLASLEGGVLAARAAQPSRVP